MRKALYILLGIVALCSTVRADKYVGRVVSDKGEPIGYATVYPSAPLTFLQPPPHPAPRDLDPPTAARPLPPDPSARPLRQTTGTISTEKALSQNYSVSLFLRKIGLSFLFNFVRLLGGCCFFRCASCAAGF